MESAESVRGRNLGSLRRSPLDLIMNQIRRKRSSSDWRPLGRFLSRNTERTGIPEDQETLETPHVVTDDSSSGVHLGWGRVSVFLQSLSKTADSRRVGVANCELTATDLMELASLLQFLPHLEEVDLSWNELIGGSLQLLTSHLHLIGSIRCVILSGCRLNWKDLMDLAEALTFLPLLEILDLSWNSAIGGEVLQSLLGNLRPAVRELHLVACQLTAADAAALGSAVSSLSRLCVLDLSCNPQLAQEVDRGGFQDLAAALGHTSTPGHTSTLSTLRLQGCGLSTDRLHILVGPKEDVAAAGASLRSLVSLRQLDLSCNKGLSGGLDQLTPHLAHLTYLESLHLHQCTLTPADLDALVQVLPSLTALTDLDVSSNKEAGGVVDSLVSALPLTQMRRLPFNSCDLNHESFTALALAVPYLHSIDVSWCKVVGGRLPLLLDALQLSIILELRLSSCDLTSDDLHHLAVVCRRGCLSSLRLLDLSYNGSVDAAGWTALFTAGGLGSVEDVDVSLRPSASASSAAWLPVLLRALPRLPALNRLAMRRWTVGSADRRQLDRSLSKRNVLLDWDLDGQTADSSSNQESGPEE